MKVDVLRSRLLEVLNDLESELLEAWYDNDPRDFDNVIRVIIGDKRKDVVK